MVEQSKQRRVKAEIQQILEEGNWTSNTSNITSKERGIIFTEKMTTKQEETIVIDTETWLTPEDQIPMIQYAGLHWTECYNPMCQTY